MWPHTGPSFHLLRLISGCQFNVMGFFPVTHPASLEGRHGQGQSVGGPASPVSPPWERGTKREHVTLNFLSKLVMGFEYKHHMACLRNEEGHRLMCCGDSEKGNVISDSIPSIDQVSQIFTHNCLSDENIPVSNIIKNVDPEKKSCHSISGSFFLLSGDLPRSL